MKYTPFESELLKQYETLRFHIQKTVISLEEIKDRISKLELEREFRIGKSNFYSLSQVCRLMNLSKRSIQRFRTSKQIPYIIIGSNSYYPKKETDDFIKKYFRKAIDNRI